MNPQTVFKQQIQPHITTRPWKDANREHSTIERNTSSNPSCVASAMLQNQRASSSPMSMTYESPGHGQPQSCYQPGYKTGKSETPTPINYSKYARSRHCMALLLENRDSAPQLQIYTSESFRQPVRTLCSLRRAVAARLTSCH